MGMYVSVVGFGEADAEWIKMRDIRLSYQQLGNLEDCPKDVQAYFKKQGLEKDEYLDEDDTGPRIEIERGGGNMNALIDVDKIPKGVKTISISVGQMVENGEVAEWLRFRTANAIYVGSIPIFASNLKQQFWDGRRIGKACG